jgi:hypothetical protein
VARRYPSAEEEKFLRDLPNATLVRLDSGHFAVEDCVEEIASGIPELYDAHVAKLD